MLRYEDRVIERLDRIERAVLGGSCRLTIRGNEVSGGIYRIWEVVGNGEYRGMVLDVLEGSCVVGGVVLVEGEQLRINGMVDPGMEVDVSSGRVRVVVLVVSGC